MGWDQLTGLREIQTSMEDARAAWDWAVARGQVERLDQAAEGLGLFYDWLARHEEGEPAFQAAASALAEAQIGSAMASGEKLRVRAKALAWQSHFAYQLGHTENARGLLQESMDLLEGPDLVHRDARPEMAFILHEIGQTEEWSGDRMEARQPLAQSLALYRALDDRWGTANALNALGSVLESVADFGQAEQLLRESLAIRRALGDHKGTAESLGRLAFTVQDRGQLRVQKRITSGTCGIMQPSRKGLQAYDI
jgi:tetratricopeptide (TPR) repeat protein